jgi:hypothetical protein
MNSLLIFTTVEGRYRIYRELFEFCCHRAYPEYDVQVMDVRTNQPYGAACMRFLVDVSGHPYTYITDIDMMIIPEKPSLLEFHSAEIEKTGLCYSNVPRWKEPMGENRMTGLHFVTDDWWEITRDARLREVHKTNHEGLGKCKCDDELSLMRIVKGSGLPVTDRGHLVSRHHGIHLGTLRDYRKQTLQMRRNAVKSRVSVEKARYWLGLISTPEYREIFKRMHTDSQAVWELNELKKFCHQIGQA